MLGFCPPICFPIPLCYLPAAPILLILFLIARDA